MRLKQSVKVNAFNMSQLSFPAQCPLRIACLEKHHYKQPGAGRLKHKAEDTRALCANVYIFL